MTQSIYTRLIAVAIMIFVTGGCDTVKNELGVGRNSPDEFTVVKRAPLTLPPDYTLPMPVDGSLSATVSDVPRQTRADVLGSADTGSVPVASADTAFLGKLGADQVDPAIRALINKENGDIVIRQQDVADKLVFWKDAEKKQDEILTSEVDAKAEAARLKRNKDAGKPLNDGDVPVIKKKTSAVDKLF